MDLSKQTPDVQMTRLSAVARTAAATFDTAQEKRPIGSFQIPSAFFRERGFTGTRSNVRARFSGEPPSLSARHCFLRAAFWAQGSHSEPSLSLIRTFKQWTCQIHSCPDFISPYWSCIRRNTLAQNDLQHQCRKHKNAEHVFNVSCRAVDCRFYKRFRLHFLQLASDLPSRALLSRIPR